MVARRASTVYKSKQSDKPFAPPLHVLALAESVKPCHVTRGNFPCNLQRNGVALQVARKTSSCDTPCLQVVSQRKIALQVAEKVEAASTFRNATRQVAACDTPLQLVNIIRMSQTFLNTRRAENIISLQVAKQVAYV